jgi:aerobic carbon-monoxide dehydrogenase large subunit
MTGTNTDKGPNTVDDDVRDLSRVDGRTVFTADVPSREALHAAFLLSTAPHARIVRIDASEARALPGVVAVLTGADIGERRFGRAVRDYPVLATDRVLFAGQRVAAVAAVDETIARAAAELIAVDYEPMEALLGIDDVVTGPDVDLHPDADDYYVRVGDAPPGGNLQGGERHVDGDVERAFAGCDDVYEDRYEWSRTHAAPLETHGCLVVAGHPRSYVYSSHKEPFGLRRDLAAMTNRDEDDFVVLPSTIGGDFGAKGSPFVEGACYFLSLATGRPVRTSMSYLEELTSTAVRHPGYVRLRTGLSDGTIRAHEAESVLDGGAFVGLKPRPSRTVPFVGLPLGPYRVDVRDERSIALYSNNIPAGHVRSPGEFKAVFAGESHVDVIARDRGEDPIAFRLAQATAPQATRILTILREYDRAWRGDAEATSGIGVAIFDRAAGPGHTRVACVADPSGVTLRLSVPDQGAGMYDTFRGLVAARLGVGRAFVAVEPTGTSLALRDQGAGASRVTTVVGQACTQACDALLARLEGQPDDRDPDGYWIAPRLQALGIPSVEAVGEARVTARGPAAYGGLAVQVSVDTETGTLRTVRAALVVDGGDVLNPVGYTGQLEGGFVYGLSQTLFEDLIVEDGQTVTASLGDYKLACMGDVPPLEVQLLPSERQDGTDVRAVGELGNIGVPAAVANAIHDAVGVRIRSLPITAEKIWQALRSEADPGRQPSRTGT